MAAIDKYAEIYKETVTGPIHLEKPQDGTQYEFGESTASVHIRTKFETKIPDWMIETQPRRIEIMTGPQWWREHYEFYACLEEGEDGTVSVSTAMHIVPDTFVDLSNRSWLARFLRWVHRIWKKVKHE